MKKIISLLILLITFAFACNQATESTETKQSIVMQPDSELTLLMRAMEQHSDLLKKALENGQVIDSSLFADFSGVHTLKATDPSVRDSTFKAYTNQFLIDYARLLPANGSDSTEIVYNQMIESCVTCHQYYCPGPIPRIKKLLLKH